MNRNRILVLSAFASALPLLGNHVLAQETAEAPAVSGTAGSARDLAADLRERIHDLRRDLVAGGSKVQESDEQALTFYGRKATGFEQRMQGLEADIVSAETEYEMALDATLRDPDPTRARDLARNAHGKKEALSALLAGKKRLEQQRDVAASSARSIQKRIDRRRDILASFDEGGLLEEPFLMPALLDEGGEVRPAPEDPLSRSMLLDLARRDPVRARPILRREDPGLYRELWPPRPPLDVLGRALVLPEPEPPRGR